MGRSQETFGKKEREKKKAKKRQEKLARKEERKEKPKASLDDMITYVDEYGRPTDTPPDPMKKTVIKTEDIQISIPKKEELPEEDLTRSGKVEFFNHDKGFGFIRDAEVNEKYFTHISNIEGGEINEGDKVTFELEHGDRGLNAIKVKKA